MCDHLSMSNRVVAICGGLLLTVVTAVAYGPAMRGDFVWDDDYHLTNNKNVVDPHGLARIWSKPKTSPQYQPMVFSSFWLEHRLWGLEPLGYHVVNIALHAATALLLWVVLTRLSVPGAFLAAAIFAWHPVHVESVAWITERKNVLSGVLYMLSLLAYMRFCPMDEDRPSHERPWLFYALASLLFMLALLSKSVTCSLPAALLLLMWWKRGRIGCRDPLLLAWWFVAGAAMAVVTATLAVERNSAVGPDWDLTLFQRGLIAGRAPWFYAGKLVWPTQLTFNYPRWSIDGGLSWQVLFPLSALALVATLWFARKRIGRGPLVAVLFFGGTLLPALGFFNFYYMRYSFVADHFQYLASLGLIVLVAGGVCRLGHRLGVAGRTGGLVVVAAVLVTLATLSWRQSHVYMDRDTLWRKTISRNPNAWMAHYNLANMLQSQLRFDDAIGHYQQAIAVRPQMRDAYYNMANAFQRQDEFDEAVNRYYKAIEIDPDFDPAHIGLGLALMELGQSRLAIDPFRRALVNRDDSVAMNSLAWIFSTHPDDAVRDSAEALRLAQRAAELTGFRDAFVLDTLAAAQASAGKFDRAVATCLEAMDIARNTRQDVLAGQVRQRMQLYQMGKPYREPTPALAAP